MSDKTENPLTKALGDIANRKPSKPRGPSELAASGGSAATSELSAIINAARERGCAEHGYEIKWLLELPMTDEEWKRFNELTGWPSRKQPNGELRQAAREASDCKRDAPAALPPANG